MKKRDFIKTIAIVPAGSGALAAPATSQTALYGTPGSLSQGTRSENLLRLSLSSSRIPVDSWEPLVKLKRLWEDIRTSPSARAEFESSPNLALERHGLQEHLKPGDRVVRLIQAHMSAAVAASLGRKDYQSYVSLLRTYGFFDGINVSNLELQLRAALLKNREKYKILFTKLGGTVRAGKPPRESVLAMKDATTECWGSGGGGGSGPAATNVLAITNVIVYTYLVAGVAALAVAVAVVLPVAAVVGTEPKPGRNDMALLSYFDPQTLEDVQESLAIAKRYGDDELLKKYVETVVGSQLDALLDAAVAASLLQLSTNRLRNLKSVVRRYATAILSGDARGLDEALAATDCYVPDEDWP